MYALFAIETNELVVTVSVSCSEFSGGYQTHLAVEHTRALSDVFLLSAQAILLVLLFLFKLAIHVLHSIWLKHAVLIAQCTFTSLLVTYYLIIMNPVVPKWA